VDDRGQLWKRIDESVVGAGADEVVLVEKTLLPEGTVVGLDFDSETADSPVGSGVVRLLQYEVREGREAGEVVVIPTAFIANRNSSFILLEV